MKGRRLKRRGARTLIGVAALDVPREGAPDSPFNISKKPCADRTCDSEGSEAAIFACNDIVEDGSRILAETERNSKSKASCISPR